MSKPKKPVDNFVFKSANRHIVIPAATAVALIGLLGVVFKTFTPSAKTGGGNSAQHTNGTTLQVQGTNVTLNVTAARSKLTAAQAVTSFVGDDALVWDSASLTLVLTGAGPLADSPFAAALQQRWPLDDVPSADEVIAALLAPQ